MKKSLIAGASVAALGLAVVPFAGVFAATDDIRSMTDTINVTVDPTCSFSKADKDQERGPTEHTYTEKLAANAKATVGTTTMVVKCNDATGYKVTVDTTDTTKGTTAPSNLVGPLKADGQTHEEIPFVSDSVTAGTAGWNAATTAKTISGKTTEATSYLKAGTSVLSNTTMTPAAGDSATIKYDVATSTNQAAGTYTGSISYTLTPNDPDFDNLGN